MQELAIKFDVQRGTNAATLGMRYGSTKPSNITSDADRTYLFTMALLGSLSFGLGRMDVSLD